jgi:hypothetical protein
VIRGATQQAGFLPLWRKDERLWIEIPEAHFDKPFLFSANVSHALGERGLYASQMGPSWLASFRRIGATQVQLVALNTAYTADTPAMKAAVEQGFSPSLLASTSVASAPHPERKSVLIDASFLLGDIAGYSSTIERAFRLPYGLDRGNSYFDKTRSAEDLSTVQARLHFATARVPLPSPGALAASPPSTTPESRSFFVGLVYNFMRLPEQPMRARKPDPRLGHFTDVVNDYSTDLKARTRVHYINRWRLEKKDPDAAMSEPRQPIVYWVDKNVPAQYRQAVTEGVLEWNKAFERIGFKNAIVVKQQPDDADFDTLDARHASVRWYVGVDAGTARGPNHSDPRTGEILDADISIADVFSRGARRFIAEDAGQPGARPQSHDALGHEAHAHADGTCSYGREVAAEMDFALDLLVARGDIEPDSPEAEAFVRAVVKDTVMHEVGHTLGLKHNFRASTARTLKQLLDREFTAQNGTSGSVMDYNPYNIPLEGEPRSTYTNTTLGPYDYWAIEYAYKPIAPADEAAELARIAARSREPGLAYADDTDAGASTAEGIDPLVNRFDLSDDPLAYYQRRLQLSRELWQRVQQRAPKPGDDLDRQRRVLSSGFGQLGRVALLVGKYVGGMVSTRDLPGPRRRAFEPVDPDRQRQALRFLSDGIFSADSFRFRPEFLASLSPDYNEWSRPGPYSVPTAVLGVQTGVLDRLMSPGTASRLLELPLFLDDKQRKSAISLAEVYGGLQGAIWSELKGAGRDIDPLRRNLQREHLKRVQSLLTRGSSLPPDGLSLVRFYANDLRAELQRASRNKRLSVETRAHLQDSLDTLTESLRASIVRS